MSEREYSRKQFLRISAGAAVGAAGLQGLATSPAWADNRELQVADPDFVVINAKVWTADPHRTRAQAFAVKDGLFAAVGSSREIESLATRRTRKVDAKGMAVIPGMIDCHNHADGQTVLFETLVGNPFTIEFVTVTSIVDKLRSRAQQTPHGYWVDGYFFDDTKLQDGPLRKENLDESSVEHPIKVHHRGGHTSWYNSKAFELAGVDKDTPNPPGGTFERDEDGNLTGQVTEEANEFFDDIAPRVSVPPEEERRRAREGLAFISNRFAEFGLTSVHMDEPGLDFLRQVRENGNLRHRAYVEQGVDSMVRNGLRTGMGDEWIRIGSSDEYVADGSFSERTLAMTIPYRDTPPEKGVLTASQEELNEIVEKAMRNGIQPNLHTNGDAAIDMGLKAIERAQRLVPEPPHHSQPRPKLTHCTIMNNELDLAERIKATNAIPQPFTSYTYYNAEKFHFYGWEIMQRAMAYRTFMARGIPAAAGSDFGPGPFDPLLSIQGMVTRTGWNGETWGPGQRVSVDQALTVYTINGAHASYEEDIKGSITPGKLADYVMLAEDPHTAGHERIKDIEIVNTVVGGEVMYAK